MWKMRCFPFISVSPSLDIKFYLIIKNWRMTNRAPAVYTLLTPTARGARGAFSARENGTSYRFFGWERRDFFLSKQM